MVGSSDDERTPLLCHAASTTQNRNSLGSDVENRSSFDTQSEVHEQQITRSASGLSTQQKLFLFGLGGVNLFTGCVLAVMIPFFPLEAAIRGVSSTVVGAVFSCFALTQLLAYPFMGRIIPVFGATRVMNWGLALTGTSTIAFGALNLIPNTQVFISACFLMRIIEAVGASALSTAVYTIVANTFDTSTGLAIGLLETMTGVGISLGPALGGVLYNAGGYGTPFYVLGSILITMAIINLTILPSIDHPGTDDANYWQRVGLYMKSPQIVTCSVVIITVAVTFTTLDPTIEKYVFSSMGITPAQLGMYFLVASGLYTATGVIWGKISDAVENTYTMLTLCLIGLTAGLLLLPPSPLLGLKPVWWLFGVGLTMREIFEGGVYVPLFGKIHSLCLKQGMEDNVATQSFVSSMFFTFFSFGSVVGPTLGGVVTDRIGFPMMVSFLALWSISVALLTLCFSLKLCLAGSSQPNDT